jgi:hypothetical protein
MTGQPTDHARLRLDEVLREVEPAGTSALDGARVAQGFALLDGLPDPPHGKERWGALRGAILAEVAPEELGEEHRKVQLHLEALAEVSAPLPAELRAKVMRGEAGAAMRRALLAHAFWVLGAAGALALALTAGLRPVEASVVSISRVVLPALLYAALGAFGGWRLLRGARTSGVAAAAAAVGAVGLLSIASGAQAAPGGFVEGLRCTAAVSAMGILVSAPFLLVVGKRGLSQAAALGAWGGLFGAAGVHLECPMASGAHDALYHAAGVALSAGGAVFAAMLGGRLGRLARIASPQRASR